MKEFIFNRHPEIQEGQHAFFAPSKKLLSRDKLTEEQIFKLIRSKYKAAIGTELHALAARLIEEKQPITKAGTRALIFDTLYQAHIPRALIQPDEYLDTLILYVKDAIGFDMTPEVPIVYNYPISYGTADAIRYNPVKHELRIHDLKTGEGPTSVDQLIEYAAYFFLEYHLKPADCNVTLSIYQYGDVQTWYPTASDILPIMDRAVTLTKYVESVYGGV